MGWQTLLHLALVVPGLAPQGDVVEKRYPDGKVRIRTQVMVNERGESIPHGVETRFYVDGTKSKEPGFCEGWCGNPRRKIQGKLAELGFTPDRIFNEMW